MHDPSKAYQELIEENAILKRRIHELEISETARKRMEETLLTYQTIFETTGTSMVIIEEDMTISLANDRFESLTGYTREEIEGKKKWTEFVEKSVLEKMICQHQLRRADPGFASQSYEFRLVSKDGCLKNILLTVDTIPGTKRSIASLIDITKCKQAEEALNESEIKFKSYAEQAIVGAYLLQDGVFRYVNPKFAQMFGYTVEECLKEMPFEKLVYAEDLPNVKEQIRRRTAGEIDFIHYTFRGVKKNGQIFHVEIYGSSIVHKGRTAAAGTILDITERKEMEDALRESKERFRQLAEVFPETIFEAAANGRATYANKHGLEQFGYTEDDLINGINIFDLVAPDDRNMVLMRLKGKLQGIDKGYLDYQALRKDGSTFYAMGFTVPIMANGTSVGVRGFILDITERKKAEEKIAHLANHDMLTDLPSLRLAKDRLGMAISLARRNKTAAAVMFIDLDGFKSVNDNLGHDAGDYVLKQVSQRMLSCVRETDTVGRVGGDEFLLIATGIHAPEIASQIAERVIHLVSQPIIFNGRQAVVGTSIGIALYPNDGENIDRLIKEADEAMYRIKKAGKNGFCFANTGIKHTKGR